MGRISSRSNPDRYIISLSGNYHYIRRVPVTVAHIDRRAPTVRMSMKTSDLVVARRKRDMLEQADDALWASMIEDGQGTDSAQRRYEAAVKRVEAAGFAFRAAEDIEAMRNYDDVRARLLALEAAVLRRQDDVAAALGGAVDVPRTLISRAHRIYVDEIVASELVNKSQVQRDQWEKVKLRAVNNFVRMRGDKAMVDITIDDAKAIYLHWLGRIAPKDGKATATPSSGNRDLGNLRVLYRDYFRHMGDPNRTNPFEGFGFAMKKRKPRPPFPTEWIRDRILKDASALATLNDEARGILLILIETGARPSEICNLQPSQFRMSHQVPHLAIEPRDDPDDPREIKTESSQRMVPLVGVALAAATAHHAKGFPRYRNRENDLSAALNKYMRANGLTPTNRHTAYSFRHSFEDRMKEAGLEDELRRILMGHTVDRPTYGSGGSLEWRRSEMLKLALPYDPAIV